MTLIDTIKDLENRICELENPSIIGTFSEHLKIKKPKQNIAWINIHHDSVAVMFRLIKRAKKDALKDTFIKTIRIKW